MIATVQKAEQLQQLMGVEVMLLMVPVRVSGLRQVSTLVLLACDCECDFLDPLVGSEQQSASRGGEALTVAADTSADSD